MRLGATAELGLLFAGAGSGGIYFGTDRSGNFDSGLFGARTGSIGVTAGGDLSFLIAASFGAVEDIAGDSYGGTAGFYAGSGAEFSISRTDPPPGSCDEPVNEVAVQIGGGAEVSLTFDSTKTKTVSGATLFERLNRASRRFRRWMGWAR